MAQSSAAAAGWELGSAGERLRQGVHLASSFRLRAHLTKTEATQVGRQRLGDLRVNARTILRGQLKDCHDQALDIGREALGGE